MTRSAFTWLITDTHFFHDVMRKECGWPEGFEGKILKACCHLIQPQDTLIHLGDVIFYQHPKLKGMLDRIPGRKILTMGNHDHKSKGWYGRNGFDFVCDWIMLDGVLLSHKPISTSDNLAGWNVHGHCHEKDPSDTCDWYCEGYHVKLDPMEMGFMPVRMDRLL